MVEDPTLLECLDDEERHRLVDVAGDLFQPDVALRRRQARARKRRRHHEAQEHDDEVLAETGIRQLRAQPVFSTPNVWPPRDFLQRDVTDEAEHDAGQVFRDVLSPQNCYVCKSDYQQVHHFYDQLCPDCAEFNFAKRTETVDLTGRVALLTGGRVKIGYQAGLKLLRAGASLIVTTRFPRDAARRYAAEPDAEIWGDRVEVYGLDLRHTPSVEAFCSHLMATRERLDFIVNNACQTVRRPAAFYRHMLDGERELLAELTPLEAGMLGDYAGLRGEELVEGAAGRLAPALSPAAMVGAADLAGLTHAAELSQTALLPEDAEDAGGLFPQGHLDADLQQVDLRGRNSWRMQMDEVSSVELLETQLVNAVAPYVLNARLKPLLLAVPTHDKHIVNVSAVEGQFYRPFKTTRHPHTNMAKAALNMMTRTAAEDYHADGIHMNAVDTGWVTDEDPVEIAERKTAEHRFHPPLDIIDGAARIVDPIIDGFRTGRHLHGLFLKDYRETPW